MEVVIWQLFVIGTVFVAYVAKGKKAAFWVSLAWTVWTIVAVFMLPFVLVQLIFCWGTYFVCNWIASLVSRLRGKDREIDELKRRVEDVLSSSGVSDRQAQVLKEALSSARVSLEVVSGSEHFVVLKRALSEAKSSVCVLSGWLGSPLLDSTVQNRFRAALSRGVRIYLGFGWESSTAGHEMTPVAQSALSFLRSFDPSRVVVAQFANHEKVLVVDEAYCVIGSNNWLSNAAFRNSERSVLVRIPSFATEESRRVRAIVEKHRRASTNSATPEARSPPANSNAELYEHAKAKTERTAASSGTSMASAALPTTYIVVTGDTLANIAKRFYGDPNKWNKIYDANKDKIRDYQAGQTLTIPP
jgi:LysM repeat protein